MYSLGPFLKTMSNFKLSWTSLIPNKPVFFVEGLSTSPELLSTKIILFLIPNSLPNSVQNKFNFEEREQFSIITIRGLGVTEIQNQIDQLMLWFGTFEREIKNFDKELLIKRE